MLTSRTVKDPGHKSYIVFYMDMANASVASRRPHKLHTLWLC